jgi:hypothetical protein
MNDFQKANPICSFLGMTNSPAKSEAIIILLDGQRWLSGRPAGEFAETFYQLSETRHNSLREIGGGLSASHETVLRVLATKLASRKPKKGEIHSIEAALKNRISYELDADRAFKTPVSERLDAQ